MESRSGIIVVCLLALGGCGGDENSLFGSPADSGAGGEDSGSGGTTASGGAAGSRSSGGSAGSRAGSGGTAGKGGAGGSGTAGGETGGSAQGGEETSGGGSGLGSGGAGEAGSGESGAGGSDAGASGVGGSGESGAGAGGSNPLGGRGGLGGTGGKADCEELGARYAELLEQAKACDANLDDLQCLEQVPSDLGCGCPTAVNSKNEEALTKLRAILTQAARSCPVVICPAIACSLTQGYCTSSGSGSGHCEDGPITE